jgi:Gpi18-like mannosyltransferase
MNVDSRRFPLETRWRIATSQRLLIAGAIGLIAAVAIRLPLLPTPGLPGDLGQFVEWVNEIAVKGLPHAYDGDLSFGPVMVYVWGVLAIIQPAFQTVADSSDPGLNVLMKLPATLADFAIAAGIGFALRDRPAWAVASALVFLLYPATWYVSAWWGQYESVYVLALLVAALLAIRDRNGPAAVFIALAVMTKPQALPFMIPFAAWFLARGGARGLVRATAIGAAVIAILWLPFLAEGGPTNYLRNLAAYQDDIFSVLSVRAWNVWWLLQEVGAEGMMVTDRIAIVGPITFRHVGYLVTGLVSLYVALKVYRNPQPRTLIVGLAAATLVAFTFLTTMHERYAYGALVFLLLLIPERRVQLIAAAFGVVFTVNLVAAISAAPDQPLLIPISGVTGVVGSVAMIVVTLATLRELSREPT